ncbi:MAG: hypothetical protein SPF92_04720 [Clostridia bacterium]|nr:hypothetical protein [Clostridia bacterium]
MKNYFNFDFENKAIVGSKTAIRKANTGNTPEYRELCKKLAEHPDFKVVPKEIKGNAEKKKYHGLTFDRMKEYILTQPDSENRVKVFEKVQEIAEAKGAKYPLTKKWFLNSYPEYKENEAKVMEEKKAMEQAEAELDAIIEEENNSDELAA